MVDQKRMLQSLIFTVTLLLSLTVKCSNADCQLPTPVVEVAETDGIDTVLLEFAIRPGDSWTLTDPQPSGYIHLKTHHSHFNLTLLRPIDLETLPTNSTSGGAGMITLELLCSRPGYPPVPLPFRVIVREINEFPPQFIDEPLSASIEEQSPGDSVVITLLDHVIDRDYGPDQMEGFELHPYLTNPEEDGLDKFHMKSAANGVISLRPEVHLDYEALANQARTFFMLNISVKDTGYPASFTTYSTLRINVTDVDDNSPVFVYDCPVDCTNCPRVKGLCRVHVYSAIVSVNALGPITIYPAPIKAIDIDTLNYGIEYSMTVITPSASPLFIISKQTGVVSQVRSLEELSVSLVRAFLKAKEISPTGYGSSTIFPLEIEIQRSDSPIKTTSSNSASETQQTGTSISIANNPDDTSTNPDGSPVESTPNWDVTPVNTAGPNGSQESVNNQDDGTELWIIFAVVSGILLLVLIVMVVAIIAIKHRNRQKCIA